MRSRSRWRILSRSSATAFMRLPSGSANTKGMASVKTVAAAASAAKMIVRVWTLIEFSMRSSMDRGLKVEVDHFFHHHHAREHPEGGGGEHHAAERLGP